MDKIEIDELKRKFKLKFEAKEIYVKGPIYSEELLENMVDKLYESYLKGENVCATRWILTPNCKGSRDEKYKLYSCDFEGITREQFLSKALYKDKTIGMAEKIVDRNGSYRLPEDMLEDFQNGSDTVYVYNGNNGISMVFDRYDLDIRTDEDFLNYATISMRGESREEEKQKKEDIERKSQLEKKQRIEEIEKQIPQWIEEGNSMIYLEKQEGWKNYIGSFKGDNILYASIVEQALEIMKCLEETGSLLKAEEVLKNQSHSETSLAAVSDIIFRFSKKGPDFYEDVKKYVQKQEIDKDTARKILNQRADNNTYAHEEKIRNGVYGISTTEIGKATINVPTIAKKEAEQVENDENTRDNKEKGEEVGDDN